MPIHVGIWKVGTQPTPLAAATLPKEQLLEDMIVAAPQLLRAEWMLIGRQENTGHNGRIDLLAIDPDGSLVLIELKRDRTPREVVAQALDYAGWVEELQPDDIGAIYSRYKRGHILADDFRQRFGVDLDEATLNQAHEIVIVAASLDESTARIVSYLSERGIPINVLCFQVFQNETEQLISRAWLLDPVLTAADATNAVTKDSEPWNGEFYCNFGHSDNRSWEDAVNYGFICAGGGAFYTRTLKLLNPGDRIWVKAPGYGFVGVARVTGRAQPASEFAVTTVSGELPVLDVAKGGKYHAEYLDDPERREYFVPVEWLQTVPLNEAVREIGLFGNRHSVCKPTSPKWRSTVEKLKQAFPLFNDRR